MRPGGGGGGLGGRTRADEVKNETFFIYTQQFSFLSFISLGLVDGRVRDDQSFWRAEGEDHLQVCGRRP